MNVFCIYLQEGRCHVDIAALQADHKNKGATFQVASNFNGIEAIDDSSTPDQSYFVTNCKNKYFYYIIIILFTQAKK